MEKIVERYTMDRVFDVIDKHIKYHEEYIERIKLFMEWSVITDEFALSEINDSACAISALTMLKNELNGEVEY